MTLEQGDPWLVIFRPCRQSNVLGNFRVLWDDCRNFYLLWCGFHCCLSFALKSTWWKSLMLLKYPHSIVSKSKMCWAVALMSHLQMFSDKCETVVSFFLPDILEPFSPNFDDIFHLQTQTSKASHSTPPGVSVQWWQEKTVTRCGLSPLSTPHLSFPHGSSSFCRMQHDSQQRHNKI